jgi:hypothetical protein
MTFLNLIHTPDNSQLAEALEITGNNAENISPMYWFRIVSRDDVNFHQIYFVVAWNKSNKVAIRQEKPP